MPAVTFASCVICNWLSYLLSSHLRRMCAPSHLRSSHLRSSYPTSLHLHHICASSYLRSLFQIFTSSLSPSGLHILKPHLVSTSSDLHHVSRTVLSYHLQDFIMQLLLQAYNLIYVRLQNFISPLSGQPSSSLLIAEMQPASCRASRGIFQELSPATGESLCCTKIVRGRLLEPFVAWRAMQKHETGGRRS